MTKSFKTTIRTSSLLALLVVLSVQGYPMLATFTGLVEIENSYLSIPFRAAIAALSFVIVLRLQWSVNLSVFVSCLFLFWVNFWLHLLTLNVYTSVSSGFHNTEFYLWATLVCFLPMLATLNISSLNQKTLDRSFKVILTACFISCSLLILKLMLTGSENVMVNGRLWLPALNPILVGYTGANLILLSLFFLFDLKGSPLYRMAFSIISLSFGMVILALSNSRGPVLSLCLILLIWIFSSKLRIRKQNIFLISVFLPTVTIGSYLLISSQFDFVAGRIANAFSDPSNSPRLQLLISSYQAFAASPIFGSSHLVKEMIYHPHNILFDSLMRVGILGTLFFTIPVIFGFYVTIRMLITKRANAWIGLLYLNAFFMACISGAIHESNDFWVLLAAIISLSAAQRNFQNGDDLTVRTRRLSNFVA